MVVLTIELEPEQERLIWLGPREAGMRLAGALAQALAAAMGERDMQHLARRFAAGRPIHVAIAEDGEGDVAAESPGRPPAGRAGENGDGGGGRVPPEGPSSLRRPPGASSGKRPG